MAMQSTSFLLKRNVGVVVAIIVLCGNLNAQGSAPTMRAYIAEQARSELAVRARTATPSVDPSSVRLEKVPDLADGIEVWRGTISSDHSHPYLLALIGGETFRLGGFSAPELRAFAARLGRGPLTRTGAVSRARSLALLADPNGAIQEIFVTGADQPGYISLVATAWSRHAPADWPIDTTVANAGGGWRVRLTLLSRATRTYTLHWVPTAYCFDFDRDGQLTAWAQRSGEIFGVPGSPSVP
jgi:hypothetical protein